MIDFQSKVNHILDSGTKTSLRFITPKEQQYIQSLMKYNDTICLDGGYQNAERKRVCFFKDCDNIKAYQIEPKVKNMIFTHQQILGSVLALNIERDCIGDIIPKENVFFVIEEIHQEIELHFNQIGNIPITLKEISPSSFQYEQEFEEYSSTISSNRLDNVIAKIINKSRTQALEILKNEYVKINHEMTTKATKQLSENDMISIRHYGRYKIIDMNSRSKKGKIILKYIKFT
jgi:RNA-binding protein YlmH